MSPPKAPSAEVIKQLDEATAARETAAASGQPAPPEPRRPKEATLGEVAGNGAPSPAAGNATANYLLADHYLGGSAGTLWAYASGAWHGATAAQPSDEAGIEQVAFASNRVDASWNDANNLTLLRCWKYL